MPYKDIEKRRECKRNWRKENPDYAKTYYTENKEQQLLKAKIIRDEKRLFLANIKSECGCIVCGIKDSRCLQFHHKISGDKEMMLSKCSGSIKQLENEISKCVVLCANHHFIFHSVYGYKDFPNYDDVQEEWWI